MVEKACKPSAHPLDVDYLRPVFWWRVEIRSDDECWLWGQSTGSHGYGQTWDGRTVRLAHRVRGDTGPGRAGLGVAGLVRGDTGPGGNGAGLVGFGPGREPPPGGTTGPPPDRTRAEVDPAVESSGG